MGPEEQRRIIQRLMFEHHKRQQQIEEKRLEMTQSSQVWTELSEDVGLGGLTNSAMRNNNESSNQQ